MRTLPWLSVAAIALAASILPVTTRAEGLPPDEAGAKRAVDSSPRHGEYVDIQIPNGKGPVRSYVVYPEVPQRAPVVIVIHEIFGCSDWIKGVTDQLAAEGFIAIAPDLLSLEAGKDTSSYPSRDDVVKAVRGLKADQVLAALDACRNYGIHQPSSNGRCGSVGFCWGGGQSFAFAAHNSELNAAVVYYGTPPSDDDMKNIFCPVAGFYGGSDNRVTSTVAPTTEKMKKLDKLYLPHVYQGAGHGFLRQQDGQDGANKKACEQAWPETLAFFKKHLK